MPLLETLEDIKISLSGHFYQNEEQIRAQLVKRILSNLGWDIWNPNEVFPEYRVAKNEDSTRVDVALLFNNSPKVYIEVKFGDIMQNLNSIEEQLRDYNRDNTAPFSIISNGRLWLFYYSQTGGVFHNKLFNKIDIIDDNVEEVISDFKTFLSKENIINGSAIEKAKHYLELNQRQKYIEDAIRVARNKVFEPPYKTYPECIRDVVFNNNRIEIEISEIQNYLETHRREDTEPIIVNNPVIAEQPIQFVNNAVDDYTYTHIIEGRIDGFRINRWNSLLRKAVKIAYDRGWNLDRIRKETNLNLVSGHRIDQGFRPVEGTNFSLQSVDANTSARSLKIICNTLNIDLYVSFEWTQVPRRGQRGRLTNN